MKTVRLLILLVMTLAILPWGGFVASMVAPQTVVVAAGQAQEAQLSAPRTCRGNFLPGSSCDQVRWLPGLDAGLQRDLGPVFLAADVDWVATGRVDAPPRHPPRLV